MLAYFSLWNGTLASSKESPFSFNVHTWVLYCWSGSYVTHLQSGCLASPMYALFNKFIRLLPSLNLQSHVVTPHRHGKLCKLVLVKECKALYANWNVFKLQVKVTMNVETGARRPIKLSSKTAVPMYITRKLSLQSAHVTHTINIFSF